jgi:hypothetical protein
VIGEIGPGVSQFATVKKFCSWLGLEVVEQVAGGAPTSDAASALG